MECCILSCTTYFGWPCENFSLFHKNRYIVLFISSYWFKVTHIIAVYCGIRHLCHPVQFPDNVLWSEKKNDCKFPLTMRAEFPFSMHGSRRSSAGNGTGSRLRSLRLQQPYGQCGRPDIGRVGIRLFWGWGRGSLCRLWKAVFSGRTVMFSEVLCWSGFWFLFPFFFSVMRRWV